MAKFIDLIENAGKIPDEKTGEEKPWHNFLFGYLDTVTDPDKGRNEIDSTAERYFQVKIKADKMVSFFGFEVFHASQFDGMFGKEIELIYGRDGVCGCKFKTEPQFDEHLNFIDPDLEAPAAEASKKKA